MTNLTRTKSSGRMSFGAASSSGVSGDNASSSGGAHPVSGGRVTLVSGQNSNSAQFLQPILQKDDNQLLHQSLSGRAGAWPDFGDWDWSMGELKKRKAGKHSHKTCHDAGDDTGPVTTGRQGLKDKKKLREKITAQLQGRNDVDDSARPVIVQMVMARLGSKIHSADFNVIKNEINAVLAETTKQSPSDQARNNSMTAPKANSRADGLASGITPKRMRKLEEEVAVMMVFQLNQSGIPQDEDAILARVLSVILSKVKCDADCDRIDLYREIGRVLDTI